VLPPFLADPPKHLYITAGEQARVSVLESFPPGGTFYTTLYYYNYYARFIPHFIIIIIRHVLYHTLLLYHYAPLQPWSEWTRKIAAFKALHT